MTRYRAPAQQEPAYQTPYDLAYQAPYAGAGLLPAAWEIPAEEPQVPRQHRLLGFVILLLAVGASLAFPVAGVVAVAAGITVLRAADRATETLAARRFARGRRAADPFVLVASMPWLLVRSVIETIALAPLVLLAAAIVVAVPIMATGGGHLALAIAAVAGLYTLLSCLGPRSRSPRRQLNRLLNAVAHTPLTAGVTTLMLCALAAGVILFAVPRGATYWPTQGRPGAFVNIPWVGSGPCQAPQSATQLSLLCAAGGFEPSATPASAERP
jgi:hypothetical protein